MATSLSEHGRPRSLADLLAPGRLWTAEESLEFIVRLAEQLHRWHRQGRLHCAIEPGAVLVDAQGRPLLCDPPEHCLLGGEWSNLELCPPELASAAEFNLPAEIESATLALRRRGFNGDPRRIDVYQLGVLMCRLLVGAPAESYLYSSAVKSSAPAALRTVLDRALGYDATARFADCRSLMTAIAAASGGAIAAPPADDTTQLRGEGTQSAAAIAGFEADRKRPATDGLPADAPVRLGSCRLMARLGQGGMGEVYQAYDESLDRLVAVKLLPRQLAADPDFVRRFRAEAASIARLSHPNIVQVYSIGQDGEHHYFVMQLVEGESLASRLRREGRLDAATALAIVEPCLAGLAAAHDAGLVHRDIKPGNILLDGEGRARLADFGLVKRIDQPSGVTATGVVLGTADYLSPEQGRGQAVDGRSDLYSVGVLLYRMLAGVLPFSAESPAAMIFQHVYETPRSLSAAAPGIPAALAAIVARLLEKDPARRYPTVRELLADLQAFRDERPLAAAPAVEAPTAEAPKPRRLRLFKQRPPAPERPWRRFAFAIAVAVIGPLVWLGALILKDRFHPNQPPRHKLAPVEQMRATFKSHPRSVAFHPDAGSVYRFLAGLEDGAVCEYAFDPDGRVSLRHRMDGHVSAVNKVIYSPDGARAASAGDQGSIAIWQLSRYKQIRRLEGHAGAVYDMKFSADGKRLLSCGAEGDVHLWDVGAEQELENIRLESPWSLPYVLAWSADERLFAVGTRVHRYPDHNLLLYDLDAKRTVKTFPTDDVVAFAEFLPNGRHLLSMSGESFQIWDLATGDLVRKFGKGGNSAALSRDGRLALAGHNKGVARLFNVRTGEALAELGPFGNSVQAVAIAPNARVAMAAVHDDTVRMLKLPELPAPEGRLKKVAAEGPVSAVALSPDGRAVAAASERAMRVWRLENVRHTHGFHAERPISAFCFSPAGDFVLYAASQPKSRRNFVGLRDYAPEDVRTLSYASKDVRRFDGFTTPLTALLCFSDGQRFAAATADGGVHIRNLRSQEKTGEFKLDSPIRCLALTPGDKRLLLGVDDGKIHVWDLETQHEIEPYLGHDGAVLSLAVSDSGLIVSGGADQTVRLWSEHSRECQAVLRGHAEQVNAVAVSADGRLVLSGGADESVRLWNAASGKEIKVFLGHGDRVRDVAISADGARGVSGGEDGTVQIWDLAKFAP